MSQLTIPKGYKSLLSLYDTQSAIGRIKRIFEDNLGKALNLKEGSQHHYSFLPTQELMMTLTVLNVLLNFDIKETKGYAQVVAFIGKMETPGTA